MLVVEVILERQLCELEWSQNHQEDKEVVPKSSTLNYSSQEAIDLNKLRSRKANYQSDAHREELPGKSVPSLYRHGLVCRNCGLRHYFFPPDGFGGFRILFNWSAKLPGNIEPFRFLNGPMPLRAFETLVAQKKGAAPPI
jgi:hypothetical protein